MCKMRSMKIQKKFLLQHKFINCETNKIFIIPMHDEIAKGTLKSILEQADVKIEEFLKNI